MIFFLQKHLLWFPQNPIFLKWKFHPFVCSQHLRLSPFLHYSFRRKRRLSFSAHCGRKPCSQEFIQGRVPQSSFTILCHLDSSTAAPFPWQHLQDHSGGRLPSLQQSVHHSCLWPLHVPLRLQVSRVWIVLVNRAETAGLGRPLLGSQIHLQMFNNYLKLNREVKQNPTPTFASPNSLFHSLLHSRKWQLRFSRSTNQRPRNPPDSPPPYLKSNLLGNPVDSVFNQECNLFLPPPLFPACSETPSSLNYCVAFPTSFSFLPPKCHPPSPILAGVIILKWETDHVTYLLKTPWWLPILFQNKIKSLYSGIQTLCDLYPTYTCILSHLPTAFHWQPSFCPYHLVVISVEMLVSASC